MRLRLRIERNALPPTQAVWPVKDGKSTIAQLVQHVNEIFPLEGETWGLEDYTVTVGGYECLHYHELQAVCRDEDEVVITPLQYVDVRSRTLTGRSQVAPDGRHLVDGVPFGRPCLKAPIRPEVRIPPRKKRKLMEAEEEQDEQLMITQNGGLDEDEDEDEDDEDFEADDSVESESSDGSSASDSDHSEASGSSSSDSDSSSSDFDSTSDSESESESWDGIPTSDQATPTSKKASQLPNGTVIADSPTRTAGAKRKHTSDVEDHETSSTTHTGHDNWQASTRMNLPHEGKDETKKRNQRRRDKNRLDRLKKLDILPADADYAAMKALDDDSLTQHVDESSVAQAADSEVLEPDRLPASTLNNPAKRRKIESTSTSITPQSLEETISEATNSGPQKNLEQQRQKLLSAIKSGGVEVGTTVRPKKLQQPRQSASTSSSEDDGSPEEVSSKQQDKTSGTDNHILPTESEIQQVETAMDSIPPARRTQLDLAGSKRLLFGSLGVRVPKTAEEKDAIQKKLAGRPKRNANALGPGIITTNGSAISGVASGAEASIETNDVEEDPEAWQARINLTAVECCDEGVELSTPPFPFYQRWDPQYNKKKKRNSSKYAAKSKAGRTNANSEYIETYDKYDINGISDALNYDDVDAGDEYWEDGALLGDEEAEPEYNDGFPLLPINVEELPPLSEKEAQFDDFIAFTELRCDETTSWEPKMVTRTAKLLHDPRNKDNVAMIHNNNWLIQLAQRDLKPKVFDDDGNRMYSKFDMPDTDVEDESTREIAWAELGGVKLVLRPEKISEEA